MKFPQNHTETTLSTNTASSHRRSKIVWLVISALVLVVIGVILFVIPKKLFESPKQNTPQQELQNLKELSDPVLQNAQQRAATLGAIEQQSAPVTKTREERLQELQSLSQQ